MGQALQKNGAVAGSYCRSTLPFWKSKNVDEGRYEYLDSSMVIGGNFKEYKSEDSMLQACEKINLDSKNGINVPIYFKVGEFSIYAAYEGKNRISLFQRHNKNIYAFVYNCMYPESNELKLHLVRGKSEVVFLSCNNESYFSKQNFVP
jgi:hypothetical protein